MSPVVSVDLVVWDVRMAICLHYTGKLPFLESGVTEKRRRTAAAHRLTDKPGQRRPAPRHVGASSRDASRDVVLAFDFDNGLAKRRQVERFRERRLQDALHLLSGGISC